MIFKTLYSPNFSKKRRKTKDIKIIVIHYTGMQSKIESIKRLINPKSKVSCHYLSDRKGTILQLVNDKKIAWHAGKSKWRKFVNLNENSIGIELVNKGHNLGYQNFPKKQINQLIKLCSYLKKKYKIKNVNVVGHSDISPLRKKDPGERFPWQLLSKKKIGFWYKKQKFSHKKVTKRERILFFKNLYKIGYRYFNSTKYSRKETFVIKAFKRRFLPDKLDSIIDQKTLKISHYLRINNKN